MAFHDEETLGSIHIPHNWEYADLTTREAATGFVAADVGKLALQLDDFSLWVLSATTPTWVAVGVAGALAWLSAPPASASGAGAAGQIAYDDSYVYVCIAANTWVRAPLSSWS